LVIINDLVQRGKQQICNTLFLKLYYSV
jgi:hypothetical protein